MNSNMSLNRAIIQEIIQNLKKFFSSGFIDILLDCIDYALRDTDTYTINLKSKIKLMLKKLKTTLEQYGTDYKRLKYFAAHKSFITPLQYIIETTTDNSRKNNEVSLVLKNRTAIYISIKKTLQSFLHIPKVFDEILQPE